jgi:hypothetical protein
MLADATPSHSNQWPIDHSWSWTTALPSAVLLGATTRAYDLPFLSGRMTAIQQGIELLLGR